MQIHLEPSNLWREHCEALAQGLGVDLDKHEARIYKNVHQAVNEAMIGLRRLYTIKKKIHFFKNQIPHTEVPLRALAKEGLQIEGLDASVLSAPQEFAAKIDRETLSVTYAVDDPVLGTFEKIDTFEAQLKDTTIFKIRVSFHRHLIEGIPAVERNTVHILGLPNGRALVLMGERVRFPTQGVELLNWSFEDLSADLAQAKAGGAAIDQKLVQAFEARTDLGFTALLKDQPRIFDRALVVWSDMDSAALLKSLCDQAGVELLPCGQLSKFESLSLSRWGGTKGFEWLAAKGFTKEHLRGAMAFDVSVIDEKLIQQIQQSRKQILEAQFGDQ